MELKLREVNEKLRGYGVPFDLVRLGNYRQGDWQIDDVISVFAHRQFKIAVCFILLAPWTGDKVEYWCQFNSTYSTEALSGHLVVPVVNGTHFLMIKSYGTFIGTAPLLFPRGFIPQSKEDLPAVAVAESLIERKLMECLRAVQGEVQGQPELLRGEKGALRLAEDQSTSGNWVTLSVVHVTMDLAKFEGRDKRFRPFKLVAISDFLAQVLAGEIADMHSLSAYVMYTAVSKG
ncbi:MAG: hypothetical protein UT02_C0018G0002 [Parcubacteria group bacterium GW2011_GWC2_38_7]|nr:MAG: hypothetical protein UT02_C0018G0002 [Parcubacteria group bacterium GW2011_GWC2_38_7]